MLGAGKTSRGWSVVRIAARNQPGFLKLRLALCKCTQMHTNAPAYAPCPPVSAATRLMEEVVKTWPSNTISTGDHCERARRAVACHEAQGGCQAWNVWNLQHRFSCPPANNGLDGSALPLCESKSSVFEIPRNLTTRPPVWIWCLVQWNRHPFPVISVIELLRTE